MLELGPTAKHIWLKAFHIGLRGPINQAEQRPTAAKAAHLPLLNNWQHRSRGCLSLKPTKRGSGR